MSSYQIQKPEFLEKGERARLIPVAADSNKEQRITSCFLAVLMSVDEYSRGLLNSVGVKVSKTSKIECFTEIVLKNQDKKIRPDGLIKIRTGNKEWTALVEAKIGKNEISKDQVEEYLDLAKNNKIDALITISNQFATDSRHHPVTVNKYKTKNVNLFHWSWTYLITEAIMWVKHHGVSDPDQVYILEEFIRYLSHQSSGVTDFDSMNSSWKDVCSFVQNRVPLKKNQEQVIESVSSWHQLTRSMSLELSTKIGRNVSIYLTKPRKDDAQLRLAEDASYLAERKLLETDFEVPDAASRIKVMADLETRTISASMVLKAPEERSTAKGRINWIINQLNKCENASVIIKVNIANRRSNHFSTLGNIRSSGSEVLYAEGDSKLLPKSFEVELRKDIGAKFKGSRTFVQETMPLLSDFYSEVGQYLREWVPPPPKVKKEETSERSDSEEILAEEVAA